MNFNLLILGEYSQFVWPAFIFAALSCFLLFLKTYKSFQEVEKIYLNEFKQEKSIVIKTANTKEILSKRPVF
jgi:heme exporter protein D